MQNLTEYHSRCGFLVSQTKNYVITHILTWISLVLYFTTTAVAVFEHEFTGLYGLFGLTIVLGVVVQYMLTTLGITDPGMIPKILPGYESRSTANVPISKGVVKISLCYKVYSMGIKTHNLKIKFCNTCNIYRPPRTSHCSICNTCV